MSALIKQLTGHPTRTMAMNLFVASIVGALLPAAAQDVYTTGFEQPAFVVGAPLGGQDGWVSPVPVLSPGAAVIAPAKKRLQLVRVDGADLESQPVEINAVTNGYYDAIGSYRRPLDYATGGTQTVRLSVDVRLDGRATRRRNFFSASLIAVAYNDLGGSESVGELALSSDGYVYGSSGQDLVPVFLTRKKVARGIWHNLAIEVDFAARTYSFFVDGKSLGTFDFEPFEPSGVLRRASLNTYAAPDTAKDRKADHASNFDNFNVEVVPDEEE